MARYREPILKRCKYLGISPTVIGIDKESNRRKNVKGKTKVSEYKIQLKEKQKLKFIYGVGEKQFRSYFEIATAVKGKTGEALLKILESRLDNVVFRMGFCATRPQGRLLVSHGNFEVNGEKVDIASYRVKPGDVISVRENRTSNPVIKSSIELNQSRMVPAWLDVDTEKLSAKVVREFTREELDFPCEEHLIIELYSK